MPADRLEQADLNRAWIAALNALARLPCAESWGRMSG